MSSAVRDGNGAEGAPAVGAPPPGPAAEEVVVAFDETVLAGGLADVRWLLHDALLGGARWVVVDLRGVDTLAGSRALPRRRAM